MLRGILRLSTTALSPLLSSSNSGLKLGEEPRFFGTFQNRAKVVDSFCGDGSCLAGGFRKTVNWNLKGAGTLNGLLTAFEKNGHAICPCMEAPQDDISLRQTRIGWPCSLRSIAQSPSTISPRTRRFAADNPAVLTQ